MPIAAYQGDAASRYADPQTHQPSTPERASLAFLDAACAMSPRQRHTTGAEQQPPAKGPPRQPRADRQANPSTPSQALRPHTNAASRAPPTHEGHPQSTTRRHETPPDARTARRTVGPKPPAPPRPRRRGATLNRGQSPGRQRGSAPQDAKPKDPPPGHPHPDTAPMGPGQQTNHPRRGSARTGATGRAPTPSPSTTQGRPQHGRGPTAHPSLGPGPPRQRHPQRTRVPWPENQAKAPRPASGTTHRNTPPPNNPGHKSRPQSSHPQRHNCPRTPRPKP
ncbi:basic salivary proline-rich protein 1-like [Gouania willdenowi]|uniref:basic salivary proline-rich protein 1-like n=1 Tax=Gouania willdenowi TaxID=441366 RepID=UPI001055A43A|nr:basic salivary proline-rich protein 1-like [Gouania willdenowi]